MHADVQRGNNAMKVMAFTASPREDGNTDQVTREVLDILASSGIDTELIRLHDKEIQACTACGFCKSAEACTIEDDLFDLYLKAKAADGIILASPVYFGTVTAPMKAFMDRAGYIAYKNGNTFRRKVGGALAVAGRNGGNYTNTQLLLWFMILGMIVPGSNGWNCAFGNEIGEIWNDAEGLDTIREFAENFAWLVGKLAQG
jgi:multimeric flavodoxin WrbA